MMGEHLERTVIPSVNISMTGTLLVAMFFVAKPEAAEVVRVPATAHRMMFDPKEPQSYVPKLKERESAINEARFDAQGAFTHEVVSNTQGEVTIRLLAARITLSMDNTIYLPTDVRPPLRVHEEGHRVINERVYDNDAEAIAREVADQVLSKRWSAASIELCVARADDEFRAQYRARLATRIAQVNERYDQMTAHGKNDDVNVVDAIEQAFASTGSTQPATARTPPRAPHEGR